MNNWPMFRHDPQHTGYNDCIMSDHLELLWKYKTGDWVHSSPTVVDGKLYIGSRDKCLYCLDANTGALMWKYRTGNEIYSSPAVIDEKVYVGSNEGYIYCLNAHTGMLIWKYKTGSWSWVHSSPAVVDGKVYFGSFDTRVFWTAPDIYAYDELFNRYLYCLDTYGKLLWKYKTGLNVRSSPAVVDNRVYVGSADRYIYCLNAENGKLIWKYKTGDRVFSSPAVVDGKLYIGSCGGYIYCFKTKLVPEREKRIKQELEDNKLYLKHLKIMYERGEVREEIYKRMKRKYEDKIRELEKEII